MARPCAPERTIVKNAAGSSNGGRPPVCGVSNMARTESGLSASDVSHDKLALPRDQNTATVSFESITFCRPSRSPSGRVGLLSSNRFSAAAYASAAS